MSIEVEMRDESNGTKKWFIKGTNIHHREDGPAIEYGDGTKYWCQNDRLHREDGPAIENADGSEEWYLNGLELNNEQISKLKDKLPVPPTINAFLLLMSREG